MPKNMQPSLRHMPSVRQLRAFTAVYMTGKISAAAELLSVTQPAITVLLRDFEAGYGVRLFDRTTRSLRRTELAAEVFAYAQRALDEMEGMGRAAAEFKSGQRGSLRVAATSTVVQTLLPPLLRSYRQSHPDVRIVVDDCSPLEFVEHILRDRVDCGIGTLEMDNPGLRQHVLMSDSLVAVAGPGVLPQARTMTWKQLSPHPLVAVKSGYGVRRQIDRGAATAGVELRVEHEVALLSTAVALARAGLGVAVVPASAVAPGSGDLVCCKLVRPHVQRTSSFIWRSDHPLPPAAASFLEVIRRAVQEKPAPRAATHKRTLSNRG